MVHATGGAGFKEAGLYVGGNRKDHWSLSAPFLEPDDRLVWGDGTVYYASNRDAPEQAFADNPNFKVVFVVREPLSRALSAFKFRVPHEFREQQDKVEVPTAKSLHIEAFLDCFCPHLNATGECLSFDDVKSRFWRFDGNRQEVEPECAGMTAQDFFDHQLVRASVYVWPIERWARLVGRKNILVLFTEELGQRRSSLLRTMSRAESFLNLRPHFAKQATIAANGSSDATSVDNVGRSWLDWVRFDNETEQLAQRFFRPLNRQLQSFLQRPLPMNWPT